MRSSSTMKLVQSSDTDVSGKGRPKISAPPFGPVDAAGVGVLHPGGGAAGLLGFHEGVGSDAQGSEGDAEVTAGDALAIAKEGNESADGEDDNGVEEGLRRQ